MSSAPQILIELVERFRNNLASYRAGHYNETQVRREFIDPFFEALGWDVDNERGYAEAYKDVILEDSIRIGGARKFFVEAKKPEVRKAGSVYYTPTYVVEYIVRHTVGRMLEATVPPGVRRRGVRCGDRQSAGFRECNHLHLHAVPGQGRERPLSC